MGTQDERIENLEEDHGKTKSVLAEAINRMREHHENNDRHMTDDFRQMCTNQHVNVCDDLVDVKKGLRRIENILLARKQQIHDQED